MTPEDSFYLYSIGTVSSAGLERCLDRAEVAGSNPARFTLYALTRRIFSLYEEALLSIYSISLLSQKFLKQNNMETTTSLKTFEVTIPEKYTDTLKKFIKALEGKVKVKRERGCQKGL